MSIIKRHPNAINTTAVKILDERALNCSRTARHIANPPLVIVLELVGIT
ncbi:hypothetical protein H6F76_02505 [Leptolyngbya sp. FACHB-321]|nr:hypothetical protein [Leptolyngbya sp. FACHB-321]MBD2033925.1 hypothetical protein [Leptolyngbya sp. FACHB-321]